ncbi:MAG: hypothetical protein JWR19_1416 [Pedosphaera sp.]|nr:hypothetical protein [Pedosphaera sp.]
MIGATIAWLKHNRTSVRAAFGLRVAAMGVGSVLGLIFMRLLRTAMGSELYGLFLCFQSLTRLGGLGDLGTSGAVALRAGQMLARGEETELKKLLASARSVILLLSLLSFCLFLLLSPWLPHWLGWDVVAHTGSFTVLIIYGGVNVAFLLLAGYFFSLNFALGTVTWPILPPVIIAQFLAPLAHLWLASQKAPLWLQFTPYIAASVLTMVMVWLMVRWAHPWLGDLRPLSFDWQIWKQLVGTSGWVYLSTLGSAIYFLTDRLLVFPGFGGVMVDKYVFNYKFCELVTVLVLSASFVGLPKITQWLASEQPEDRRRLISEADRLNLFQIILGCAAALSYLIINDKFVALWQRTDQFNVGLPLQIAFACNLAITTGGDAGIQIASRCGEKGIRAAGIAVGGTGLLNLTLSYISMRMGSVTGIAGATVLAQTVLSLGLGAYTCRHLKIPFVRWAAKSWLLPVVVIGLAGLLRNAVPPDSVVHVLFLCVSFLVILVGAMGILGLNREMLAGEWRLIRGILSREKLSPH